VLGTLFPLSPYQQCLYHQHTYGISSPANSMILMLKLRRFNDSATLISAFQQTLNRYPYLKHAFTLQENQLAAKTKEDATTKVHDLTTLKADQQTAFIKQQAEQSLDPSEQLCEFHLFRLNDIETVLLFKWHHMAGDIVSSGLVFKTFFDYLTQKPDVGDVNADSYEEFVKWQQEFIHSAKGQTAREFWQNKMKQLPPAGRKEPLDSHSGAISHFVIDRAQTGAIKQECAVKRLTFAQYFLALFHQNLAHLFRYDRVLTMMPINNRPNKAFRETIGYFVNFVPIVSHQGEFDQIKQEMTAALNHSSFPFNLLYGAEDKTYGNLFEHVYKYQDEKVFAYDSTLEVEKFGVKENIVSLDDNLVEYPRGGLSLIISHSDDTIKGAFHYNKKRYSTEEVVKLQDSYLKSIKL
jgi:hypothetical protein